MHFINVSINQNTLYIPNISDILILKTKRSCEVEYLLSIYNWTWCLTCANDMEYEMIKGYIEGWRKPCIEILKQVIGT